MTIEEFLAKNPTRQEIAFQLCALANHHILPIDETYIWEDLSKAGNFTKDDFYDDQQATKREMGVEAITHHGIVNWKLKKVVLDQFN